MSNCFGSADKAIQPHGQDIKNSNTKLPFSSVASMLNSMNELDEFWSEKLSAAIENARDTGRGELADYLELKAANDAVRQTGVEQFLGTMIDIATRPEHAAKTISIERESPHSFRHRDANMVGSVLRLSYGVRCMTVEAGWTRTPTDGFMRLGAFAFARITHLGIPRANGEFILKGDGKTAAWAVVRDDRADTSFDMDQLNEHFLVFIG